MAGFDYQTYWDLAPSGKSRSGEGAPSGFDDPAREYTSQLRTEGSFANGIMQIPGMMNEMASFAAAGEISKAEEVFNRIGEFYAGHVDDTARAVSIQPKGDKLLGAIQRGALIGYQRDYDKTMLNTPYGQFTAGQLFGPDGLYHQFRDDELRRQYFSEAVIDAVNGDDKEKRLVVTSIVDPSIRAPRRGEKDAPRSQAGILAHEVATNWDRYYGELGADGIGKVVGLVKDQYMNDGTAASVFRTIADNAVERLRSGAEDDPVKAVYSVESSYRSLLGQTMGKDTDDSIPAEARRALAMTVAGAMSAVPGLDLDNLDVRAAVGDVMGVLAKAGRAGAPVLQIMQSGGTEFSKSVAGYVNARSNHADPPRDNHIRQVIEASDRLSGLLTSGWTPVEAPTGANPQKGTGDAGAILGARSASIGLNVATVAVYKAMLTGVAAGISHGELEPDAFRTVLSGRDDMGTLYRVADALEDSMLVPRHAALGIATALFSQIATGGNAPGGLEQAIADYAFGGKPGEPLEEQYARESAEKWYAANMGPNARAFDQALEQSGIMNVLNDPLLGWGGKQDSAARIAAITQHHRKKMLALALQGLPVGDYLKDVRDVGRYYYVAGYQSATTGEILHDVPDDIKKALESKDPKAISRAASKYVPVIDVAEGHLDSAQQLVPGWQPPGFGVIPSFGPETWSREPLKFRAAQEQFRRIYQDQNTARQKAMKDIAERQADELEFGSGGLS